MSTVTFSRAAGTITFGGQTFPAANNVDSHSLGPWPLGTYAFAWYDRAAADGPNGAYGSYGALIFSVPGRSGLGIHSGRVDALDGLGRCGVLHCTEGCIRTTDQAMAALVALQASDPVESVSVGW
jgi:hypothetical protein